MGEEVEKLLPQMADFLKAHFSRHTNARIFVACSAGVDSMVLSAVLVHLAGRYGFSKPHLLHVNYKLRQLDSDLDERCVIDFACSFGLQYAIKHAPNHQVEAMKSCGANLQSWARSIRYDWFEQTIEEGDLICLAHHSDDVTETVLMRMARGSGLNVGGMRPFRMPYWRPFLGIEKSCLYEYADRKKVPYREDRTNDSLKYTRNVIRNRVIPELDALYPGASNRIALWAQDLQDVQEFLNDYFSDQLMSDKLNSKALEGKPVGVVLALLASFLRVKTNPYLRLQRTQLLRLYHLWKQSSSGRNWSEDLAGKWRVCIECDYLYVEKKHSRLSPRAAQHRAMIMAPQKEPLLEPGATLTGSVDLRKDE